MLTRQSERKSIDPWKYFDSVSTEIPAAPPIVYVRAIARCSSTATSRPFDGVAFLISAMSCMRLPPLLGPRGPSRIDRTRLHCSRRDAILATLQRVQRLLLLARLHLDALVRDDRRR